VHEVGITQNIVAIVGERSGNQNVGNLVCPALFDLGGKSKRDRPGLVTASTFLDDPNRTAGPSSYSAGYSASTILTHRQQVGTNDN